MELTSLHDFYGSWHLYICRSLFGHSNFFVDSLVFMKGTSCCVIRRNFKRNRPFATNGHMGQNPPCWRASLLLFPHWESKTMRLYHVMLEFSLFWMSQCGNNNKLALQLCPMWPFVAKGLLSCWIMLWQSSIGHRSTWFRCYLHVAS